VTARAAPTLDRLGLLLLAVSVGFQALFCWPEVGLGPFSVHDGTLHHALALRLIEAVGAGESPLDPWVSFSSMGSPVWRSYQPLVHQVMALCIWLASPIATSGQVVGALTWLVLCLHPPAFFVAARWMDVGRFGAGLTALLCLVGTSVGNLDPFGLGYGSTVWMGSGLLTQLWAAPLFVLAVAASFRALRGDGSVAAAAALVGVTALCHLIFGFAAALSALLLWAVSPSRRALLRLVALGAGVASLCAFLVVPALLDGPWVNHSVWEPTWKWASHGAPVLMRALVSGGMFDAGRLPVLSVLLAGAAVVALRTLPGEPAARATLALTGLWLLLSFGRATWGALLPSLLINEHVHMHRFVAVFQASAMLLLAVGVDRAVRAVVDRPRLQVAVAAGLVLAAVPALRERADALRTNASLGLAHRLAVEAEQSDLAAVLDRLEAEASRAPGRTFAGLGGRWGKDFLVGRAPAYHALGLRRIDATSHLWHSMSIPSDGLLLIDDASADHLRRFGVRYVLSEAGRATPGDPLVSVGRFTLRQLPGGGYFSVERDPATCAATDAQGRLGCARDWLAAPARPAGRVLSEERDGAAHGARVELDEPGTVVFRSSFHPGWRVWVDGVRASSRAVVPGFLAVDVPQGRHDVRVRYRPGAGKTALLLLG
jgi:hypothetical protein